MIKIKVKVTATQNSKYINIEDIDGHATLIDMDDIKRLVYSEGCGALTTWDIGPDWLHFKRDNEWISLATFEKDKSNKMRMVTEVGELQFNIHVLDLKIEEDNFRIHFELLEGDELIDTHVYTCEWVKEEEAWLVIH